MAWRRCWLLTAVLLVVAGCSGSTASDASDRATSASSDAVASGSADVDVDAGVDEDTTTTTTTTPSSASEETSSTASITPLAPAGDPAPATEDDDDTSAWISRRSMSSSEIEVQWSAPEGSAEYRLHRVEWTSKDRPDASAMTDENQIYVVDGETGFSEVFLDTTVTAGNKYWYGIRGVAADGIVMSTGWARMDAVDDEVPPSPAEVSLDVEDGVVTMTWLEVKEDYELSAYQILRSVDGQEPEVIATTWNLDQRSFVDDDPPEGVTSYGVASYDFHYNNAEPTLIDVDLS